MIHQLPQYYRDVPPVTSSIKNVFIPAARVISLAREVKQDKEEEYLFLHKAGQIIDSNQIIKDANEAQAEKRYRLL